MPLLTDEPLIDDSELDEFDWDAYLINSNESQPVTFRGYIVKLFHEVMQTTCLVASAVLFKSASWVLGHAVWHTDKLNRKRRRLFGVHPPVSGGITFADELLTEDEEQFMREHGYAIAQSFATNNTKWVEAEPCSDFDPIHPDYVPYPEK